MVGLLKEGDINMVDANAPSPTPWLNMHLAVGLQYEVMVVTPLPCTGAITCQLVLQPVEGSYKNKLWHVPKAAYGISTTSGKVPVSELKK